MAGNDKLFNQVVSNLRACLISAQGGIPLTALNNDYRQLLGENIPYKKLGFPHLENLVESIPEVVLRRKDGEIYIEAKASDSSKHISKLVERQKKTTSSKVKRRPHFLGHNRTISLGGSRLPPQVRHPFGRPKFENFRQRSLKLPPPMPKRQLQRKPPPLLPTPPEPQTKVLTPQKSYPPTQHVPIYGGQASLPNTPIPLMQNIISPPSFCPVFSNHQATPKLPLSGSNTTKVQSPKNPCFPGSCTPAAAGNLTSQTTYPVPPEPVIETETPDYFPAEHIVDPFAGRNPAQKRLQTKIPEKKSTEKAHNPPATTKADSRVQKDPPEDLPLFPTVALRCIPDTGNRIPHPSTLTSFLRKAPLVEPEMGTARLSKLKLLTPIQEKAAPTSGGFVAKLVCLCRTHGWPDPIFILLPRKPSKQPTLYTCRVTVLCPINGTTYSMVEESNDFTTFPNEFVIADEAKDCAAKIAYLELSEKIEISNSPCDITVDENEIINRVTEIVGSQNRGIWAFKIEQDYRNLYNEILPQNWVEIIKKSEKLLADKLADTSYIIRPKPNQAIYNGLTPKKKISHAPQNLSPPDIELPPTTYWNVYITRVISTDEIWLRFVGENYSVVYEAMANDMFEWYINSAGKYKPIIIENNKYYGCQSTDGVARVKVLSTEHNEALVQFIDHGDIDKVPLDSLCILEPKFYVVATQAIKCKLHGSEKFSENSTAQRILVNSIEGKVLVAEVASLENMSVIFHDTSLDIPLNINNHLSEIVNITNPPRLAEPSTLNEAIVSGCNARGDVYLQISTEGLNYVLENLQNITEDVYSNYQITDVSTLQKDKIYLVVQSTEKLNYRVKICGGPLTRKEGKVNVFLIDYGRNMKVSLDEIYDLESISDILSSIPPQIICVHLKDLPRIDFSEEKAVKLEKLAPQNEVVLVKVAPEKNSGNTPVVELFKRMQPSNILVSINHTIIINSEITFGSLKTVIDEEHDSIMKGTIGRYLQEPIIPDLDEKYFDIYVVEAANPSNFIVQPLSYLTKFKSLMSEMQTFYKSKNEKNIALKTFQKGTLCAAVDKKGFWCRASIDTVLNNFTASVRYCDYGNIDIIPLSDLRELHTAFTKFPAIGFNAKIAGILPLHGDWSVEDCIRIKELIEEKKLVSIIREKILDHKLNHNSFILSLHLIDTNSEEDVDIAHQFVLEHRAKYL